MNTLRSFEDRDGTQWEAWEAHPAAEERRRREERRATPREDAPARRDHNEGRPEEDGWLVFRTGTERRRHIPIPPEWQSLDTAGLRKLLNAARPSGPRSRILG